MTDNPLSDPHRWVDSYGDVLYRFALVRVRDRDIAEELVQDTLLAALQAKERFAGQSSERTWMVGILKHKMIDYFRRTTREPIHSTDRPDDESPDSSTFEADGHWKPGTTAPSEWLDHPDSLLERKQFWDALTACLGKLPPRTAQAFTLREVDEVETDDICQMLCLTPSNLWVILHRARKQLRQCLDSHYFGQVQGQGMVEL